MNRSEVREAAFILTFEKLFTDEDNDTIIDNAYEVDEFELDENAEAMFKSVAANSAEADELISKYSEKRQLGRIPKVSLAILRIAIYEIIHDKRVPNNAAVCEAVILGKKYAYPTDVQFINGVLGAFVRDYEKEHPSDEVKNDKDGNK